MAQKKRQKRAKAKASVRARTKRPAARPRTFEEVRVANLADPVHAARIARLNRGERFDDATAKSDDPFVREVSVHPDCEGGPHWIVEWGDSDGGCYVTTFDGPMAEQRARAYFDGLKRAAEGAARDRMTRRKGEITGQQNERDFPHLVELELPSGGFRGQHSEFDAFHRERRLQVRRGRGWNEAEQFYVRFCFPDAETADAFRDRFGGKRMTYTPERARPRLWRA